jgi:hypothetical protein
MHFDDPSASPEAYDALLDNPDAVAGSQSVREPADDSALD